MNDIPSLSYIKIINALQRIGFVLLRQKGSNIRLQRRIGDRMIKTNVPAHKPVKRNTLRKILKQAEYVINNKVNICEPYGGVLSNSGEDERQSFIGNIWKWELGSGNWIFTPLASRSTPLPRWTPYHYSANNPVSFLDPGGMELYAKDEESQNTLLDLIPENERYYIVFDDEGNVDKDIINSYDGKKSSNFEKISFLVNSDIHFHLAVTDKLIFKDKNGIQDDISLGKTRIDNTRIITKYNISTKEVGFTGYALLPGNSSIFNSPDNNVYAVVNSSLSRQGRAESATHELLGHALVFSLGMPGLSSEHLFLGDDMTDYNILLKSIIIHGLEETRKNFK